jgi:hypothetical protein
VTLRERQICGIADNVIVERAIGVGRRTHEECVLLLIPFRIDLMFEQAFKNIDYVLWKGAG